jgi:hypothetical protein
MRIFSLSVFGLALSALAVAAPVPAPTFSKNVAPILQNHCQECHRPGEAAPMSLLSYQEARPWAKSIKAAVLSKKMPPWPADPSVGHFANDRSLSQQDRDTLIAWVDAGAPEGSKKDLPAPRKFIDGWNIGTPDQVIEMPDVFNVPASGTIDYQYVILPLNLKQDTWVQAAEVRPGNRALVHHVIAFIREPGSKWMRDKKPGEVFVPEKNEKGERQEFQGDLLCGFAPGMPASVLEPGTGRLLKAGSDVVFQLHYTANGNAGTDKTRVGIVFAKQPPAQRVLTLAAANNKFVIPAGDPNYKVDSEFEFNHDVQLRALMPHMHLRGKDFDYRLILPTGETEKLLNVPHYDFSWQLWYNLDKSLTIPKGAKIACTAHYDNSPNNAANPDASKEVRYGDQSWEEMMIGFFDVTIPADMDPRLIMPERKPQPKRTAGPAN